MKYDNEETKMADDKTAEQENLATTMKNGEKQIVNTMGQENNNE